MLERVRCLCACMIAFAALSCSRTPPPSAIPTVQIIQITADVEVVPPRRTVDVAMTLVNKTSATVDIVSATLLISGAPESIEAEIQIDTRAGNPTAIRGSEQVTLWFELIFLSLPEGIVVDGEVVVVGADGEDLTIRGAEFPWLVPPSRDPDTDLLVTVADDELDGGALLSDIATAGGPTDLSLREAVTIANNRLGRDLIRFDAGLFAVTAPSSIVLGSKINVTGDDTIIDASGRGVILDGGGSTGPCLEVHAAGFSILGVVIANFKERGLTLEDSGGATVDGVTFRQRLCCGNSGAALTAINTPGLVVRNSSFPTGDRNLWIVATQGATVEDSTFIAFLESVLVETSSQVTIRNNSILGKNVGVWVFASSDIRVEGNAIVGNIEGAYSRDDCVLIDAGSSNIVVVDNVVARCGTDFGEAAVAVRGASFDVTIARTLINDSLRGIRLEPSANRGVQPPVITTAGTSVSGTSTAATGSLVEVFIGATGETHQFVGEGLVDVVGNWSVTPSPELVGGELLTGTVTDPNGSTSELATPFSG